MPKLPSGGAALDRGLDLDRAGGQGLGQRVGAPGGGDIVLAARRRGRRVGGTTSSSRRATMPPSSSSISFGEIAVLHRVGGLAEGRVARDRRRRLPGRVVDACRAVMPGLVGQILQRRAAGQQVVDLLDPVGDRAAGGVGWTVRRPASRGRPRRWFPAPAGCRSCGRGRGRGRRAAGPTTPGSVSAKTASPAAPRSALRLLAHVDVGQRQAAFGHQGLEGLAGVDAGLGGGGVGLGREDQPFDKPAFGLHEFGDALLIGVAQGLLRRAGPCRPASRAAARHR